MVIAKSVIEKARKEVRPTDDEEKEKRRRIDTFIKKISPLLGDATAILGGSAKKDTWLRGSYDADIFVSFPFDAYSSRSDEISDLLEGRLKKMFRKISRVHGSRDYFQVREEGIVFEIIPILGITSSDQAVNITDISPLHAKWVVKHVRDPDEVRLAKAFAKAQGVYGAESFIKGFSGYCIEILIVHYGGFQKMLEAVSKWKKRTVIDMLKYHKNIGIEVNQSKLISPLVLIDPVQKGRNVAAALSEENYKKMIAASKRFLRSPSLEDFRVREVTVDSQRKVLAKKVHIILKIIPKEGKEDIVGGKLLKCFEYLEAKIEKHRFTSSGSGWYWDRGKTCLMWFSVKEKRLPDELEWQGPPESMVDFAKDFRSRYPEAYVKDGKLFAMVKREHTSLQSILNAETQSPYIKEKVKKVTFA